MHNLLVYGFPLILVAFEWGFRTVLSVDSWEFMGPTLTTAGLSFLAPLTKPNYLDIRVANKPNALVTTKFDQNFIVATWLAILAFFFLWGTSCYYALKHPQATLLGAHLSTHFFIGMIAYIVSLAFVRIKEMRL